MTGSARLLVVGLSHRTAPIEVRERFAVSDERLEARVRGLVSQPSVRECVVLSTCNRTEYYVASRDPEAAARTVCEAIAEEAGLTLDEAAGYLFRHDELDAVTHLYRVTAGLDSLVIGEPQIQGQVGEAYDAGRDRLPDSVGPVLHRLFQSALAAGGRVRTDTRIAQGSTSIPSAAVKLARKVFGSLEERTVLVVGTGEMGALTVRCLRAEGVARVLVASRDARSADRLASLVGGEPVSRELAWSRISEVDLMVTATDAQAAFVTRERLAVAGRGPGKLVVLDIALPRNVHPEAGELPGVFLYNIDDLQRVVDSAQDARSDEVVGAEAIVLDHVDRFWEWYRGRAAAPLIRALRRRARAICAREVEAVLARSGHSEEEASAVRMATRAALNKILHGPTEAARRIASEPGGVRQLERLRALVDGDGRGEGAEANARDGHG